MKIFINYLLEANAGLILFLLLYRLTLTNETNFNFKRGYLLFSILISIIFPFLDLGAQNNEIPSISQVIPSYMLPEVVITQGQTETTDDLPQFFSGWVIVKWIYLGGVLLLFVRFLIWLNQIIFHLRKSKYYSLDGKYKIVEVNEPSPTFSFFNYIIIGQCHQLTEDEKALIIKHETVHADKFHSIDILAIEVLKIVFWFNPFLSIYKKILTNLHEFQADQRAVERYELNQYCNLLARVALMSADFKLANHFNNSLTLKRINMMKTIKKRMSAWKVVVIIPVVVGFFFVVACQDQVMNSATEIAKMSTTALDVPKEVQDRYDALQKEKPEAKFVIIETDEQGKAKLDNMEPVMDDLLKNGDKNVASVNVITPKVKSTETKRTFLIVEYSKQVQQIAENSKSADGVFTIVEEPASFVGGMDALYKFINDNLRYPEEYRKASKGGRVYVQFVANTDGSVSDVLVLRGINAKLDSEAVRVVKLTRWNPGRQNGQAVRSKFVLPFSFKDDNSQASKIEEVTNEFKLDFSVAADGDARIISGTVRSDSGTPLAGTNVVNVGTTSGTKTDAGGKFMIKVPAPEGQLAVSFVGYKTQIITYH